MFKRIIEAAAGAVSWLTQASGDVVLDLSPRLQLDDYSCGVQSLAAILDYFDYEVDLDEVSAEVGLTRRGCDEYQLRRAIKAYGLRHRTMKNLTFAGIQRCIDDGAPILAAPNDTHWIVIRGYGADTIYVMDPTPSRAFAFGGAHNAEAFLSKWNRWGMAVGE